MPLKKTKLSGDNGPHDRRDPDIEDLEIGEANDVQGGPTTASLDAGLPSEFEEADDGNAGS